MPSIEYLQERVYFFYPKNISVYSTEYEQTKEYHLLTDTLKAAIGEPRWQAFKIALNNLSQSDGVDLTYYSLANTCFTWSNLLHLDGYSYCLKIYISILAEIWSWKAECSYIPKYDFVPTKLSRSEAEALIKQFEEEELLFKQANPIVVALQEPSFKLYIAEIARMQSEIFGYKLLPDTEAGIVLPDIEKPNKSFGSTTIFDCLLTDLKF